MDRQHHAADGAQCIGRVDASDTCLTQTIPQQRHREQRERHAREECRGKHHQQCYDSASQTEERVTGIVARQGCDQPCHAPETLGEHRDGNQSGDAHPYLGITGIGNDITDGPATAANPQPPECQA